MKMSKKRTFGIVMAICLLLVSGLAFSQDRISSKTVMHYIVSLYAPYNDSSSAGFSMCFGRETESEKTDEAYSNQMPQRMFFK
ncbi:MAG: hypothetical protein ACQETH_08060 [Candidatus Rifleibacteriota bacterium]